MNLLKHYGGVGLLFGALFAFDVRGASPVLTDTRRFADSFESPRSEWESFEGFLSSDEKYLGASSLFLPAGASLSLAMSEDFQTERFPIAESRRQYSGHFYLKSEDANSIQLSQLRFELLGFGEVRVEARLNGALGSWTRVDFSFEIKGDFDRRRKVRLQLKALNKALWVDEFLLESRPMDSNSWVQGTEMVVQDKSRLHLSILAAFCHKHDPIRLRIRSRDRMQRASVSLALKQLRLPEGVRWEGASASQDPIATLGVQEIGFLSCVESQFLGRNSIEWTLELEVRPLPDAVSAPYQIEIESIFD